MIDAIAKVFKRTDISTQRLVAEIISEFVQQYSDNVSAKRAFDVLEAWVANKDDIVKFYAAKGLWGLNKGRATEVFNQLLRSGSDEVKHMVMDLADEWGIA